MKNQQFIASRKTQTYTIKVYELNHTRSISIDINNGKDRAKLKHILKHERYRLRKRDISRFSELLEKTKH